MEAEGNKESLTESAADSQFKKMYATCSKVPKKAVEMWSWGLKSGLPHPLATLIGT